MQQSEPPEKVKVEAVPIPFTYQFKIGHDKTSKILIGMQVCI